MFKNKYFKTLIISIIFVFFIAACGGNNTQTGGSQTDGNNTNGNNATGNNANEEPKEVITLKIADNFPVGHAAYDATVDVFIPALEESGRIKVEYYPSGQLGDIRDMVTLTANGSVDIGYTSTGLITGEIPLSSVFGIPGTFTSATEAHLTFSKLVFEGTLKSEFERFGIQPVSIGATDPYEVFTNEKQVKLPEDLQGLKIRGVGGDADLILDDLGVTAVNVSSSEIYESISKGVTDGTFFSFATAPTLNLQEVVKHATLGVQLGNPSLFHFMNMDRFNELDPEVQEIIMEAGAKLGMAIATNYDERAAANIDDMEAGGVTVYQLTDADKAKWQEALAPAADIWIESMNSRGASGAEDMYNEMLEFRDEIRNN